MNFDSFLMSLYSALDHYIDPVFLSLDYFLVFLFFFFYKKGLIKNMISNIVKNFPPKVK